MLRYLVITSDYPEAGRGVRGHALVWFLRTYYGRRGVRRMAPADVRRGTPAAETVFLALPTSLAPDEIERLADQSRCRRLVCFDYLDANELQWSPEQAPILRSRACAYLKPWFDGGWGYDVRMGALPLRRYGRFTTALVVDRMLETIGVRPKPKYDVFFLGRPNTTRIMAGGVVRGVDQRFDWIRQIRRAAPELSFWGGLVGVSHEKREQLEAAYGSIDDLLHGEEKVNFARYWRAMRESRVLLCPGGNVPWTYRHYECLYAGGVVVTIDFRNRDMLAPLPSEGVIHVPDGADALPYVREALALSDERGTKIASSHREHLERFFRFGTYSRSRPALLARFLAQFA